MTGILRALLFAAILGIAGEAHAQSWPTRPVKLIVPTGAGHAVDIMARMLATGVSQTLGQTVVVENMPGASGFLGAQTTARAEPDGHTFLFAPASLLSTNMYLFKSLPYDPTKDFAAVALVCDKGPMVVTVNPDLPVKTVPELIAYGKANPGKLSYAVDATSGFGVATGRLLNKRGQIGMVEIPYRSSPQMAQDTMAGNVQLMVGSMPPVAGAVKAGKLRWIAVSSEQRFPGHDDLPTIAETMPGFRVDGWFVVVGPAGTPAPILQKFNREIDAVVKSQELRTRALAFGLGVSDAGTPESTQAFIRGEQERWRNLVTELGMEAQ
ncbi:MAG: tripartite tricarboxylate transporter substrate binding protein [Xanthobacteraceae bacterium]|nr:tripartite tricarboxylate transporter substrate binding protein [Xanthobacteraceae bacterium]